MPAADRTAGPSSGFSAPFTGAEAVTPGDANELTNVSRSLYVGTSGDLAVVTLEGNTVTFKSVPVGWFPGRVKKVMAAGTTASNIVSVW